MVLLIASYSSVWPVHFTHRPVGAERLFRLQESQHAAYRPIINVNSSVAIYIYIYSGDYSVGQPFQMTIQVYFEKIRIETIAYR